MTFYLGEAVLFAALLLTSLQVLRMRSELRRMRSFHAEFQSVFSQTEAALGAIQSTVRDLQASGREVVEELGQRIDTGCNLLRELKSANARAERASPRANRGANAA
jgi:hypothetical protein